MPSPFEGVTDFFSEMARMREAGRRGYDQAHESGLRTHATAWVPATDIFAREGDSSSASTSPACTRRTWRLRSRRAASRSRASARPSSAPPTEDDFFVHERPCGEFRRSIMLPATTKDDDISAEFMDGVAEITVAGGATAPETRRIKLRKRPREPTRRSPA